jgi:hypothetical protein
MNNDSLPNTTRTSFDSLIRHPVVLLLIGFALTGLLGQWIASSWQRREWDREQSRLIVIKTLDQKYGMVEELLEATGENSATVRDFLLWLEMTPRLPQDHDAYEETLKRSFQNSSSSASVVEQKLKIFFRTPEVQSLFAQIKSRREGMSGNVLLLQAEFLITNQDSISEDMHVTIRQTERMLEADSRDLKELINKMTIEINDDVQGR